jgi:hypothetical protein
MVTKIKPHLHRNSMEVVKIAEILITKLNNKIFRAIKKGIGTVVHQSFSITASNLSMPKQHVLWP